VRADATLPHVWTDGGVAIEAQFTGVHLLHLAAAGCVLNDVYRESVRSGVVVVGALVTTDGDFDRETWQSTGVVYTIELDSPSPQADVRRLLRAVDEVAEIPRAPRPRPSRAWPDDRLVRSSAPRGMSGCPSELSPAVR
jgi:hypothetical protein